MIKIKKVYERPNLDVPFHIAIMTVDTYNYIKEKYKDTNKMIMAATVYSEDMLQMTYIAVWKTKKLLSEYKKDPIVKEFVKLRNAHNLDYGIKCVESQETKIDKLPSTSIN